MKRRFALIISALLTLPFSVISAHEKHKGVTLSGGADIVSGYIWRGLREAGVSFQPVLTMGAGNFSLSAWGSADFASASYKEMDLTASYEAGPLKFSVADIYCVYPDKDTADYGYFNFGSGSPHRIEAGVTWRITRNVPVTLAWYTTLMGGSDYTADGKRAYASYAEVSYPFTVRTIELKAGIGIVPWNAVGVYGIDRSFYVQNIFLDAGKSWNIEGAAGLAVGLFTSISWNPALGDVNFTGGISLRM